MSFIALPAQCRVAADVPDRPHHRSVRGRAEPRSRNRVGFAGGLYKDEPFGIDDRADMGTEVLLTRRIMTQMNVMVNPARKYVVTTEYSLD